VLFRERLKHECKALHGCKKVGKSVHEKEFYDDVDAGKYCKNLCYPLQDFGIQTLGLIELKDFQENNIL
jgi:hypothetical protein